MLGDAIRALYVAIRLNDADFYRSLSRVNQATDEAVKRFKKMNEALEDLGKYMAGAGVAMSAALAFGVKEAADFEQALMNLKKVMPESTDFNRIAEAAKAMAKAYGRSITDILAAMELWGRQGKKQEEVIKLTNAALQWAIAENIDVAEATEYLTYIMNGFNLTAEDAVHIVDALNEVSNNYATDSVKLARSLQEAAGVANQFGVSLEQLIGYATALHAKGYEAGEAGNFLAYTFSKLYDENVIKLLRHAGIEVKTLDGKLRDADEILADLAKKWKTLDDETKHAIASQITVGGRVSMIYALFDNWGMAVDAANSALNSHGSASREVAKALETFHVELKKTWTSLKLVGETIGGTLIPMLKPALKLIQGLANAFLGLPAPVKTAVSLALGLTAAIFLLGGGALLARAAIFRITETLFTLIGAEMGAMTTTTALRASLLILAKQGIATFTNLARAVLSFSAALLTNPITWIILGIVGAILLLQDVLVKGWENSYLGKFVNWLLEKLPFLKPVAEGVAIAFSWLRQGIEWLSGQIRAFITWIQQAIDSLGPLKLVILAPVFSISILTRSFGTLRNAADFALGALRTIWDNTVVLIIEKIRRFIDWIWQAIGSLGPLKYILFGSAGALLYLAQNFDKLKDIAGSALKALRTIWDHTIGAIITKINEFIAMIQNAWKAVAENPIIRAMTGAAGAVVNAVQYVTPQFVKPETGGFSTIQPKISEIMPRPTQISTVHRVENKTIHVPKIEIHVKNGDPVEIERAVRRIFSKDFGSVGIY